MKAPVSIEENSSFSFLIRSCVSSVFRKEGKAPLRLPSFDNVLKSTLIVFVS